MLSYSHRFHGHSSLRFALRNGKVVRDALFTLKYTSNPHRKNSRVAIIVSKKVLKGAVGRNRIRRRLYEIVRQELDGVHAVYDIVIIVNSSDLRDMEAGALRVAVHDAFSSAGLYKNN